MSTSTTKYCKGCDEEKDLDAFYRKRDSICKLCTNEYQRERRKNQKASLSSEDIAGKIVDRLFEERSATLTELNESILQKLEEIKKTLDKMTLQDKDEDIQTDKKQP
jgi:DNA anti-recombination protein RmuC